MISSISRAVFLLGAVVAALVMSQATLLLGNVQSAEQSSYTMSALTRPPLPFDDNQVVAALESWRATALPQNDGGSEASERLLDVVRSAIGWHVALDMVFFAPALALLLAWFVRRSFPDAGAVARRALPVLYLVVDEAETWWTWKVASGYLTTSEEAELSGTATLISLSAAKWLVLLVTVVVIVMGALVRATRFQGVRRLARLLWSVRVQVFAVLVFTVLVALPVAGPLDQIPDLLRSALDESWKSSSVRNPLVVLLVFSALIWGSGMLIVGQVPVTPPPVGQAAAGFTLSLAEYFRTRRLWLLVTLVLLVAACFLKAQDDLRPSNAAFAAATVALVLLALDFLLSRLANATGIDARPPRLQPGDAIPLEWVVVVLAAIPLAVGGLGMVRAYAPLVLLQSADENRTVHDGATAWFWGGAVSSIVVPLVAVWVLRRLVGRGPGGVPLPTATVPFAVIVGSAVMTVIAVAAGVSPARQAENFEAHGLLTVWLGVTVALLGLLQWLSEKEDPVALARVLGLARTPWIALVVVVPMVASSMDTDVGYHSVTLNSEASQRENLKDSFDRWYAAAAECRAGQDELPLVLVAAPGGGARAAYWTGQVMAGLQAKDPCGGDTVFAASGVSGGSVGLAVWSATAQAESETETQQALATLVGPEALSATVAAMLFRDLPRAFVGIHPYGVDRAAVEQDVWIEQVKGLGDDFYTVPEGSEWAPRLMLNASDIATGCKVVVSQMEFQAEADPAAQRCKEHPVTDSDYTAVQAGSVDAAAFLDPADCAEEPDSNLSLAAAALLSARFPYVSPSGALTACLGDGEERLYAADGGYLENTGLHTLLAIWQDLEPLVAEENASVDGPRVVPIALLVDNHYRSPADLRRTERVRELTGPPNADRAALLSSSTLEQAVAAEFSKPLAGLDDDDRWFVIAPATRPDVTAPLGWSLSSAARTELDCQIPQDLRAEVEGGAACAGTAPSPEIERLIALLAAR